MIVKLLSSSGRSFSGVIRYNDKNASEALAVENFPASDIKLLRDYFHYVTGQNGRIKNSVFHASLSFPPGEVLNNETYIAIARDYMSGMGYGSQPYAVFLHTDREHLHLHIISTRVDAETFKKIDDYDDEQRSMVVGAIIEEKYDLRRVLKETLPDWLKRKTEQFFEQDKDIRDYFKSWRKECVSAAFEKELQRCERKPLNTAAVAQIDASVRTAMNGKPRSIRDLRTLLEGSGIEVTEAKNRAGRQCGILFALHRKDAWTDTTHIAERGIPSSKLPCFAEVSLAKQLYENRRQFKAGKAYVRKYLNAALKKAETWESLREMLEKKGIGLVLHEHSGGIYGVSFRDRDIEIKGSQMGKKFSADRLSALLLFNFQSGEQERQLRVWQERNNGAKPRTAHRSVLQCG